MIGPGSLQFKITPPRKRRTPTYIVGVSRRVQRAMRRSHAAATRRNVVAADAAPRDTGEAMLLHHGPYELPTATVRAKKPDAESLRAGLVAWVVAQLAWLRPRAIPVAAALATMIAGFAATRYLGELAKSPERVETGAIKVRLVVDVDPTYKALNASHQIATRATLDW